MHRRFHRRGVPCASVALLLAGLLCVLVGCGSRLPERDFQDRTPAPAGTGAPAANANTASDVGVTSTEITVGMIDTVQGVLGNETFSGPMYGAQAWFRALNDRGGVNGRRVKVSACDDNGYGVANQRCARKLVEDDKVFAFAGNSIYSYTAAGYVSDKGVPDVGGQPIGTAYETYPHLYSIYGSRAPRAGKVGWNGELYASTEVYRYFKEKLGARTAAVVSYNQADSARYAQTVADGLRAEGYTVLDKQVDFALPNFAAAVVDMRSKGVDIVFDAVDTRGNAELCKAMDGAGLRVTAKVTNVQNWNARVGEDFKASPTCRDSIYATSNSRGYTDTAQPAVAEFRAAMKKYFPDREDKLSQWELEGWASAMWLTDAIASCGANVTRACVEAFVNRPEGYDAHGLLIPVDFKAEPVDRVAAPTRTCFDVARWQDAAPGGWVGQVPDMTKNCFDVPSLPYKP